MSKHRPHKAEVCLGGSITQDEIPVFKQGFQRTEGMMVTGFNRSPGFLGDTITVDKGAFLSRTPRRFLLPGSHPFLVNVPPASY